MTTRTTAQWREIIDQQQSSGMDVRAYCQQHDINIKTFYNRRAKFGLGQKSAAPSTPSVSSFIKATPIKTSTPQDLFLSVGDATLSIPQGADPAWVGQLLKALAA